MTLKTAKHTTGVPEAVPTDPALPGLSLLSQPAELMGLLSSLLTNWLGANRLILDCRVKLRRHVPGKRCILALELSVESKESGGAECRKLIGKVYGNDQGKKAYDTLRELRDQGFADGRLTVSEPLAYDPRWQLLLLNHSQGELLRNLILAQSDLEGALEGASEWLAKLHGCKATGCRHYTLQAHLSTLRVRQLALEQVSRNAALSFGAVLARTEGRLNNITEQLLPGPTHHDFSPDHLLVDENRFTGLDFDEFRRYDPLFDVAHFMAHVGYLGLLHSGSLHRFNALAERFLAAYQRCAPNQSLGRLELYLALAYLKLAQIVALVTRPANWQEMTDTLLAEAYRFSQEK